MDINDNKNKEFRLMWRSKVRVDEEEHEKWMKCDVHIIEMERDMSGMEGIGGRQWVKVKTTRWSGM